MTIDEMRRPGEFDVETASGLYVDLNDPDPATIVLDDVAHHLAHICRYTGACDRHYSVAEHAVLVARILEARGHDPMVCLIGLHHDDHEAYTGDVGRPLKRLLAANGGDDTILRRIEQTVQATIATALHLPVTSHREVIDAVKDADDTALAAEAYYLMPSRGRGWHVEGKVPPANLDMGLWHGGLGWSEGQAKAYFVAEHGRYLIRTGATDRYVDLRR